MKQFNGVADSLRSTNYRTIIANLKRAREGAGVSQIELSRRLAKSENFIVRIETGERRLGIVEIVEIAHALGANPEHFFSVLTRDIKL